MLSQLHTATHSQRSFQTAALGLVMGFVATLGVSGSASAAEERPLKYNRDIRPILAEHCFACHGPDSASRKADLRLDQRDAAVDYGAILPGDPEFSELVSRVFSDDPEAVMPPPEIKKPLSDEQKQMLRRWVAEGAEYEPHWSFIPPKDHQPPAVANVGWVKTTIDQFILAKLEQAGLEPAPEADPRTLFRRLHLDITGLPPSPEDAAAFEQDYASNGDAALSEWIDRLMKSPAWGEHRARYWLDAARYGDTHGLHFDNYREMWPYRDWVIRSFNRNQPFDEFTVEQIAGDLLPEPTEDQLIATGFQRCNITTNEGGTIDEENLALYAADRVQTLGWIYLGLTTNCSQCHDHKFDPITMKDYYSLAAYFRNTTQPAKDGNVKDGRGPILVVPSDEDRPRWEALPGEIAAAVARRDERRKAARPEFQNWLAEITPEKLAADVSPAELVAHVPLNEGEGTTVADFAAPSREVKANGDIAWESNGKLGPAPVVKPGSTFIVGDAGDFERNQPFSYGAWIKPTNAGASAAILSRMDEQAAYRGWDLWQQGRAVAVHIIDTWPDNALKMVTQNEVLKPNEWQHVFATYDGSGTPAGVKIYIDGKEQPLRPERNALKADASIRTPVPFRIGQRSHAQAFEGGVQDVRVYGRLLAAAEIEQLAGAAALKAILATPADNRSPQQNKQLFEHYLTAVDPEYPPLAQAVSTLEAEREAIRARSPITHIQEERKDSPAMAHILIRGEYDNLGAEVAADVPEALHPLPEGAPANRLGLAQWLVDPANPLTARVTVNRFWQQVFGRGIVATPEDFGVMGAIPTHPELLDWLALDFQQNGWDVQRFFKQIFMSATYRQAAITTPEKLAKDVDNALLSRGPRFRMDAEMIRDSALAAAGLLSRKMYGPGVKPYQPEDIWSIVGLPGGNTRNYEQDSGENLYRRTVYTFWKRMAPPPNLDAFNAPSREFCVVKRERTNTPLQALVTLNDPQFVEAARHLAQNAMLDAGDDAANVIDHMAQRVLGRSLSERETARLIDDHQFYRSHYQSHPADAQALIGVGDSPADERLDPIPLAAWTMVANQLLNLDEALNK